jgi:hypothetical protein
VAYPIIHVAVTFYQAVVTIYLTCLWIVPYRAFEIQGYKVAKPLPKTNTPLCTTNLFSPLQCRREIFAVPPYEVMKKNIFEMGGNIFEMGDLLQDGLSSLKFYRHQSVCLLPKMLMALRCIIMGKMITNQLAGCGLLPMPIRVLWTLSHCTMAT